MIIQADLHFLCGEVCVTCIGWKINGTSSDTCRRHRQLSRKISRRGLSQLLSCRLKCWGWQGSSLTSWINHFPVRRGGDYHSYSSSFPKIHQSSSNVYFPKEMSKCSPAFIICFIKILFLSVFTFIFLYNIVLYIVVTVLFYVVWCMFKINKMLNFTQ